MSKLKDDFPVALIEDRYAGTYSGGLWLAVASKLVDEANTRAQFCLQGSNGPYGSDIDAATFWRNPPHRISSGATPDEALKALGDRKTPRKLAR